MLRAIERKLGLLLAAAVLLVVGTGVPAVAADVTYDLRAGLVAKTMPGGEVVQMYGLADETTVGALNGTLTVPGPTLVANQGDNLIVNLLHTLPTTVPTSFMVHGQLGALLPSGTPVPMLDGRMRSMTHETQILQTATYSYSNLKPGTYLYESATYSQVQVPMGLYGVLIVRPAGFNPAAPTAYAGLAYDTEATLVFSEIDSRLNAAVIDGDYGTSDYPSTVHYKPNYFFINGEAFPDTAPVSAGNGDVVLLRLVNTGSEARIPTINGLLMTVLAEDGNLLPHAYQSYGPTLAAGKTLDVLVGPVAGGVYPIFDQRLGTSNNGAAPGGMISFLEVPFAAVTNLTLTADPLSPQGVGAPVEFTAAGTASGLGGLEYKFWLRTGSVWAVVQDYSLADTWVWDTSEAAPGSYFVQAAVRSIGSSVNWDAARVKGYELVAQSAATGATLGADPVSPQMVGASVLFSAAGAGGTGSYEYRFWRRMDGGAWQVVQPYSTTATWTWDTTGATGGRYYVQVDVRSLGSTANREAAKVLVYDLLADEPANGATLAADPSSPQAAGTSVLFTAGGAGGTGTYEYRFWLRTGGAWAVVQPYSTTSTWTWETTGLAVGPYYVQVDVRNAGSTAYREAARVLGYIVE